jgi:DNA-binding FadR family transcriptional regulator
MFQNAKPTKIFQDVVAQIEDAILTGRLKTGDILPSERELKDQFRVGRGTLREALRVLEQKGLIEIRLGVSGGSVVREVDAGQVSESLALLIRSQQVSLKHLAQFREDVEGIVAAHAAERCTADDLRRLKDLLAKAGACVAEGPARRAAFIEVDKQIHQLLAEISQNPIYVSILHSVHDNIHRYYDRFLSMDARELDENYKDLCAIVAAIERKDGPSARRLSQEHVKRFGAYMQRRQKAELSARPSGRQADGDWRLH